MNQQIGIVTPYQFEGNLILSMDGKLVSKFGGKLSFKVFLDRKGRLNIISEQHV